MEDSRYTDAAFADPPAVCDVIMKGGIASGVVYPLAIAEIARRFRLASVGGTSVGAHAAAAAAAAEYGRHVPGKGFVRLTRAPREIAEGNLPFLQPSPALKPLFDVVLAAISGGSRLATAKRAVSAAIKGFRTATILGVLPGAVIALPGLLFTDLSLLLLGLLLALIGVVGAVAFAAWRMATTLLRHNDYGLCPGIRQPGHTHPGNTDWLADLIDDLAGRDPAKDPPLTFGDLAAPGNNRPPIEARMMTTNLTLRRPYSLPLSSDEFAFRLADFERLFPERIVEFLKAHCQKVDEGGRYTDLYKFPEAKHLPLVVAARLSASLPLLFCAVPLYAKDPTLGKGERDEWRKNLFTDGGLSSNFPIHFFDSLLPSWPTFAISLDEYDARRQSEGGPPAEDPRSRVWLADPKVVQSGSFIAPRSIDGLGGFLAQLVDAAKDWQDNVQGTLAGYRDRIVHVNLKPDEGGLNVAMPPSLALTMATYGAAAGATLRDDFDFDEHLWRRFLVAMTRLDETLDEFATAYEGTKGTETVAAFLAAYGNDPLAYKQSPQDLETLLTRARELAALAKAWRLQPDVHEEALPHPKTDMRITPRI